MKHKLNRYFGGIRTSQLAGLIQASPRTVRQWASLDLIPHGKSLGGHHYSFSPEQVDQIRRLLIDGKSEVEKG